MHDGMCALEESTIIIIIIIIILDCYHSQAHAYNDGGLVYMFKANLCCKCF